MADLVKVISPHTEAELAAIVELLEAHEVPCFVYDAPLNGVSSGVHGCVRKPRTLMVPATRVAEAMDLIGALKSPRAARNRLSSRLCALARLIWLAWHRPVARNFK